MFQFPYFHEDGWRAPSIPYFEMTVLFISVVYVLETYLDIRQHRMLKVDVFPKRLDAAIGRIDAAQEKNKDYKALLPTIKEKFHKSRAYGLDKSVFGLCSSLFGQVDGMTCLLLGYFPWLWTKSGEFLAYCGFDATNEISRALVFTTCMIFRDTLIGLPFSLYSNFVIEERHGFNKQTYGLFFMDKLKGLMLSLVIGYPVIAALIYIIHWGGEYFYMYVWAFLFVFSIIMITIVPVLIMPLFNKFDPLEEGELRSDIEALAKKLEFPLTKLFVCDGSKRSSHSNAYFYGFMKSKRIVLFDTLLTQATNTEIVGILGHELGHWKLWHTMQAFVFQQVYFFTMFYVFGMCMNDAELFASFGFETTTKPVFIGLMLFAQTIWSPVEKILSFLITWNTRRNEFQADEFACNLGYGDALQSGLTKISIENLSNMNPDPWYSGYHYSHPPLVERLSAMEEHTKKMK